MLSAPASRRCRPRTTEPPLLPERFRGEAQTKAFDEFGHAARFHLEGEALAERAQLVGGSLGDAAEFDECGEELLEAGGRDDLEDTAGLVACVPERVPLSTRLVDELARPCLQMLVTEKRAHATFDDEAVFVLVRVAMKRRGERSCGHRVLDEREAPAGLVCIDHEPNADASEKAGLAVCRPYDLRDRNAHDIPISMDSIVSSNYRGPESVSNFHETTMADEKRPYRMNARATRQQATRERITASAVELHGTLGPSRTSMSAVAEHAGVRRSTLYRHFPDEGSLFEACTAHWMSEHPLPDIEKWATVPAPHDRLRLALAELYSYYEGAEPMLLNVLRDLHLETVKRQYVQLENYMEAAHATLMAGRRLRGGRHQTVNAAVGHAIAFTTWRSLVRDQMCTPPKAVEMMCHFAAQ